MHCNSRPRLSCFFVKIYSEKQLKDIKILLTFDFITFGNIIFKQIIFIIDRIRAGEGISEPLSDILYNMLSDELFKHPATQIESLVLSCR